MAWIGLCGGEAETNEAQVNQTRVNDVASHGVRSIQGEGSI